MMNLKINHTFRVEKLCERIAISENLNKEDVELAKLIGLLHDIGRFEQWRIYKDDFDPKTVDHAKYGVEVLKENNFIKKFTNNNPDTLYKAIKYHNKYKVPKTLSDRNKLFANIIRDADKIDIFNLFIIKELTPKTNNSKISALTELNNTLVKAEAKLQVATASLGEAELQYSDNIQYLTSFLCQAKFSPLI